MTELVLRDGFRRSFPGIAEGIRKAQEVFESVQSFKDTERVFLKGAGLSANTYRSYLEAVRQFYGFTSGKHPLQVTAADIEAFYDAVLKRADLNTAYLRIMGLKRFFAGVRTVLPIFTSPFESMSEKLTRKLGRSRRKRRTKTALTKAEADALLCWLRRDSSPVGRENLALVTLLLTSGLRASELCGLRWGAVQKSEGWYCSFVAKGGDTQEQPLLEEAVDLTRAAFKARMRREPKADDALFFTLPAYKGDRPRPLAYHALWSRIVTVGRNARDQGIIARDLAFTPHLFRRSFATLLVKGGMDLKAVQMLTRHASLEVLARHYVDSAERPDKYFAELLRGPGVR